MKSNWKKNTEKFFVFIALSVMTFLVCMKSGSAIMNASSNTADTHVFKYIGYVMSKGFMPYKDVFDHKGPLLFIINCLGVKIRFFRGVWLFELAAVFVSALFTYKTIRLWCSKLFSLLGVFAIFSILYESFSAGNMTEEYSLPFLCFSCFAFADYFKTGIINRKRLFALGMSCACVFLLRVNNCALYPVFCFAVIFKCGKEKAYTNLLFFVKWFSLGFVLILFPVLVWLKVNGAFNDFIEQYFVFNKMYSSDENRANFVKKCKAYLEFLTTKGMLFSLFVLFLCVKSKKSIFNIANLIFVIFSIYILTISGQTYGHYKITLVPCLVYPSAIFLSKIQKESYSQAEGFCFYAVLFIFLFNCVPQWKNSVNHILNCYADHKAHKSHFSKPIYDTAEFIKKNTKQDDYISVYGNLNILYLLSQRMSVSKYSYQFPIGTINPKYMDEYFDDIKNRPPKIIVIQKNRLDARMKKFLEENWYSESYKSSEATVFIKDDFDIDSVFENAADLL